ncbi:MAG: type IV-A pilus assembly ATPase PilB [Chromatiales bacterium]|nr:type IV-A pilus assembly ATPase PilB [Chromatiales bacterium]
MATTAPQTQVSGIARLLVRAGLLPEPIAEQASRDAREQDIPLVLFLVQNEIVPAREIAHAVAAQFGLPLFDIRALDLELIPMKIISARMINDLHALPLFKRGKRLFVGIADPTNMQALDEIKFHTGLQTEAVIVEADKLEVAIEQAQKTHDVSIADLMGTDLDNADLFAAVADDEDKELTDDQEEAVVGFVNKVLLDGINKGVSDVHFEPYEKTYRVRFRQDGILQQVYAPPAGLAGRIAARIKVMASLDVSERRVPQDGRIKLRLSRTRAIDFRVSTCPTLFGEKIVMRLLDPTSAQLGIDALGYDAPQKELFMNAIHKPQGMVLVTGPTGSGKTVSLYTAMNILNTAEVNISTAEDPAEINLPGINQVNVNPKAGLTFASALRSFLRQDPDIIMVGEIRDLETAEIAIKAAQTGHMVLSTLHTNDAPQTLTRLVNMGIAPYNIATSVNLIIAQRLARRLCAHCKQPTEIPREALLKEGFSEEHLTEPFPVYRAVGCPKCTGGYKGRVGIYQVMPVSDTIGRIIMEGGNAIQIADQARKEGIPDLRRSGLKKVRDGLTSLEEVNRVTKD